MSFKTQIEAIVGDIDSPDYNTQAGLYLVEGVKFITKSLMNEPSLSNRLTQSSTLNNSPTTISTANMLKIVSITRNDGSRDRKATEIQPEDAADYTDTNSIYYTSKLDPKYYISNGTLNVIPTPASGQSALVKHITPDTSVATSESSIDNFPPELERGVVLYASKELLRLFLNNKNATLVALSLGDVSPPSVVSVDSPAIGSFPSAPAYNKPTISLDYTAPGDLGVDDYLTNEDVELAEIALQKHAQTISNHQTEVQNELNEFNGQLSTYQLDVQKLIEQAQLDAEEETIEVQNYAAQVESYAAQVNEEVQKYQLSFQEVVQDYNWYAQQYQLATQDLVAFLSQYIPIGGGPSEVTADDRQG